MSILSLPAEILQQIVQEATTDGFESLMLTCKAWYNLGLRYAPDYNIRRKRFRHFRFSYLLDGVGEWDDCTNETGYVIPTVGELMQTLAEEPGLSHYIRYADFKTAPATSSKYGGLDKETRGALQDLVASSPHLKDAQVAIEEFNNGLAYYQADWVLLLTLLPNVTRLSLPSFWRCPAQGVGPWHEQDDPRGRFIWKLLDTIVRRANDPDNPDTSLSKLEHIDPMIPRGRMWDTSALESFVPFMAINSVREATLTCINGSERPLMMRWPQFSPNLERLDLVSCEADHVQIYDLISRLPGLKTFRFAYGNGVDYPSNEWNVAAIMDYLSRLYMDQLEELSLVVLRPLHHVMASTRSLMWRFRRLKRLELSLELMMGSYIDVRCTEHPSHALRWQDDAPLREYLPASVETFNLHIRPGSLAHPIRRGMQMRRLKQLFVKSRWEKDIGAQSETNLRAVTVYVYGDPEGFTEDVKEALNCVREWGATIVHEVAGLDWADFDREDGAGHNVLDTYMKGRDDYKPNPSWF